MPVDQPSVIMNELDGAVDGRSAATSYVLDVSTRRMEKLVVTLGIDRLSMSQVSVMAKELDAQVGALQAVQAAALAIRIELHQTAWGQVSSLVAGVVDVTSRAGAGPRPARWASARPALS